MINNTFLGNFDVQEEREYEKGVPSIKEIALMHIRKISEICCQEFTVGYWEEKPLKVGNSLVMSRVYHPDIRAVFCKAVDFLTWIVYPSSDVLFKKFIDDFNYKEQDMEKKVEGREKIFKEMNIMFDRIRFFESKNTRTERSK